MSIAPKVKKRFNPANGGGTMGLPVPKVAVQEEDDDPGPIGPRKNPNPKKPYGNRTKLVLERLHVTKLHKNSWIDHVKKFSEKNNIPYACALTNPNIKMGYEKGSFTTKSNVYEVDKPKTKRGITPSLETEPKPKKAKAGKKSDEFGEHVKILKKLGLDDRENNVQKRVSYYDKLFDKYDKPLTDKEDKAFVKERTAQSERDRKKRIYHEKKAKKNKT